MVKRERERNGNKSSDGPWEPGKITYSRASYEKQHGSLAKFVHLDALGSRLHLCQSLDYFQQLARAATLAEIAVASFTMLHQL